MFWTKGEKWTVTCSEQTHSKLLFFFFFLKFLLDQGSFFWTTDCPRFGLRVTLPMVRGKDGFSATVYSSIWRHDNPGHGTRNARGDPLQVYINIYVCILTSKSILQSSTELAHAGYIYIVFCVLLIVLCFIMFLLSWDRSLGRCF